MYALNRCFNDGIKLVAQLNMHLNLLINKMEVLMSKDKTPKELSLCKRFWKCTNELREGFKKGHYKVPLFLLLFASVLFVGCLFLYRLMKPFLP